LSAASGLKACCHRADVQLRRIRPPVMAAERHVRKAMPNDRSLAKSLETYRIVAGI
jgi:hypothetical protein